MRNASATDTTHTLVQLRKTTSLNSFQIRSQPPRDKHIQYTHTHMHYRRQHTNRQPRMCKCACTCTPEHHTPTRGEQSLDAGSATSWERYSSHCAHPGLIDDPYATHVVPPKLAQAPRTHAHTFTRSHAHTLTRSHARTLSRSHAHTLTRSHAHTLTRSHAHTSTSTLAHTRSHAHTSTHTNTQQQRRRRGVTTCRPLRELLCLRLLPQYH